MARLITLNGIPPQLIGDFNAAQQNAMVEHVRQNPCRVTGYKMDGDDKEPCPEALMPFAQRTIAVVEYFKSWGAEVQKNVISIWVNQLAKGEATFKGDFNLHADQEGALKKLHHNNMLCIRTLCASRDPADFIELTGRPDMEDVLYQHQISPDNPRAFDPVLMQEAINLGAVITPKSWDMIAYDGATPHFPKGASEPNQRILLSGWIEILLPPDWKARVQNNDIPQWKP